MSYKQLAVRIFLTGLVILLGFLPLLLSGCGVTADQRFWDATFDNPQVRELNALTPAELGLDWRNK